MSEFTDYVFAVRAQEASGQGPAGASTSSQKDGMTEAERKEIADKVFANIRSIIMGGGKSRQTSTPSAQTQGANAAPVNNNAGEIAFGGSSAGNKPWTISAPFEKKQERSVLDIINGGNTMPGASTPGTGGAVDDVQSIVESNVESNDPYQIRQKQIADAQQAYDAALKQLSDVDDRLTWSTGVYTDDEVKNLRAQRNELAQQAQQAKAALDKANEATDWEGRKELIDEYQRLGNEISNATTSEEIAAVADKSRRRQEVYQQLREGDLAVGNGERDYSGIERAARVVGATGLRIGGGLINAGVTAADYLANQNAYGDSVERRLLEEQLDSNNKLIEQMQQELPEFNARLTPGKSQAELRQEAVTAYEDAGRQERYKKLYDYADRISDSAARQLNIAKEGLSQYGKAGVDIAENVLEMGFDAGVGVLTGGGSLASMFARVFGDSAREARQAGADVTKQFGYGLTKGMIEVATEKMFDGVAKIYGAGAADDMVESLIGKLSDNPVGQSFLRLVAGAAGEGGEEVVSDLLSPFAEAIYSDKSLRELYGQIDPSELLYSFIIGSTIGLLGGSLGVVNGQYAEANAKLAENAAGLGDIGSQVDNAMDVLSGKVTPEQQASKEAVARRLLGLESPAATQPTQAAPTAPAAQPTTTGIPALDVIKTGQVQTEAPAVEAPAAEAPVVETPAAETVKTPEQRKAEIQQRMDEINAELDAGNLDQAQMDALVAEGEALYQEGKTLDRQIEAQGVQQQRVDAGEVSKGFGTPENHIDNRTPGDVSKPSVKAFQFDHPELHEHFVGAAQALMEEVQAAEMQTSVKTGQKGSAVKRGPVRTLMDMGLTKPQIMKCLSDIIANNGQENYAAAKKVEIVLNDMMSNGWTGNGGQAHDANADYIAAKDAIDGGVKADSWEKYLADHGTVLALGEVTEDELRAEWEAMHPEAAQPAQPEQTAPAAAEIAGAEPETNLPPASDSAQVPGVSPAEGPGATPPGNGPTLTPTDTTTAESTNGSGPERERNMAKNLRNNEKAEADLRADFETSRETYRQLTNAEVVEKANAIVSKGFEGAKQDIYSAIEKAQSGMKLPPEFAVAGYHLANEMTRRGDIKGARELASAIAAELTYAGQVGQIGRVILNMDPSVRIMTVNKIVDKMNGALTKGQKGRISKKSSKLGKALTVDGTTQAVNSAKTAAAERMVKAMEAGGQTNADNGQFSFADEAAKKVADSIKQQIKNSMTPAKPKNTLDTFVNYVKRFAREKTGNLSKQSAPMTATQFLTEVVNNESLMREVYEKAQAQFAGEDSSGYREFVQDYLDTPIGLDSSDSRNKVFTKAIAESALATKENNAKFVRDQEALGVSRGEIAERIANDLISKTGAEGSIADSIRGAANDYVQSIIQGGDTASETQVERIVNNVMRTLGERFRNLAVQGDVTKASLRDAIAGEISSVYALSPESAERIADTVANQYDSLLSNAIQKELQHRFAPKERQSRQVKEFAQKLTEAVNLGAFDSEYASEAIKKLFGVEGEINIDPDLLDQYANAQTDAEADRVLDAIKDDIAAQVPATFVDKFTALRYLNMLGNIKTQGRNIVGNTAMMLATDTKRAVQAVAELAASAATGGRYERNTSLFTSPELRKQARADFEQNLDYIKGESKFSDTGKKALQGIQDRRTIFGSGESSKWASSLLSGILGKDVDVKKNVLENARNLTNWAMDAGDVIFMKHTYTQAFAGWMKAHGIEDVSNATQDQLARAREFAAKEAQEATFHDSNKVSDFVSKIGRGDNTPGVVNALAEGVLPFRKTPANVAVRAVEYSPLGIAKAISDAYQIKGGTKTGADVINDLSKTATGTGLAIAGYLLAAAGKARGSGDDNDEDLNYFQKMRGASDYSVKIGDSYVSLSQFAPMAIPFFMGVKLNELMENSDEPFSLDSIGDILGIISDPMLEMSMLSGVNDTLNNIASLNGDTDAIPSLVTNAALGYLTQGLSNTLIGQFEQAREENRQTVYSDTKSADASVLDQMIGAKGQKQLGRFSSKIPGWDYNQQDYVDAWGRTQSTGGGLERYFNALINPTYSSGDRSTRVDNELERLHRDNRNVEGFPSVLPEKRGRNQPIGDGVVMTPDEYLQFSKDSGQMKLDLVSDFMDSTQYQQLNDRQRAEIISNLYAFADDRALARVKSNYGIETQSTYDKLLSGLYEANGDEKRPPLEEKNIGEFIAFDTARKSAENNGDFDALSSLFNGFNKLNENTQAVLAARDPYARLVLGTDKPGTSSDIPPLDLKNVAEYARFETGIKDATASRDYSAIDDLLSRYTGLDDNTKTVLEKKNPGSMKGVLAFLEAGSGSESYYKLKDAIGDAQWDMDSAGVNAHVKLAGLADADIPDAEKDQLVDSGAFSLSATSRSAYDILRGQGMSPGDISKWFTNADWYASGPDKEAKADGKLNAYEVAVAISKIPGLSESERSSLYQQFKSALQNPNDAYDTWKRRTYKQALGQSSNYGRTVGRSGGQQSGGQQSKEKGVLTQILEDKGIA